MFRCELCQYQTKRKANLIRHQNRKTLCNTNICCENTQSNSKDLSLIGQETSNNYVCNECSSSYKTIQGLNKHKLKCRGASKLQCDVCKLCFASSQSLCNHKKRAKCLAVSIPDQSMSNSESSPKEICHNTTSINGDNNSNIMSNSNNNSNNNTIIFNVYGSEDLSHLENDHGLIERLKEYGKKQLYGLRDIQNEVFYDTNHPENFTIIKPDKYGSDVMIRNSDGEFEFREFDDVRDTMLDGIEKYISIYNNLRKRSNIQLREEREKQFVKQLITTVLPLDIYVPCDLIKELGIDENRNMNEKELEKQKDDSQRKFDKASMKNMYIKTQKYFKEKNGEYIVCKPEHNKE